MNSIWVKILDNTLICQYLQVLPLINTFHLGNEVAEGVYCHFLLKSVALQKRN